MTESEKRRRKHMQNLVLFIFLYLGFAYIALHIGAVFNSAIKGQGFETILNIESLLSEHIKQAPFFKPTVEDIFICVFLSVFYWAAVTLYLISVQRKFMFGKEQGTAEWAGKNERDKIMDKNPDNNIILTQTEGLSIDTRKIRRNLNVLIIGSTGTGKSRFYAKPNILQANTSFVITDPKGELLRDTGFFLEKMGYEVKVFNLKDMDCSSRYNPFEYIKSENDVMRLINCLIKNTTPKTASSADPFWEKSETALLQAIFYFMWYELVPAEQNFKTVLELLRYADVKEEDENYESDLDIVFKQLEEEKPDHIAIKQYKIFKQGAGKTAKSILISVGVRLSIFNMKSVSDLTEKDELDLYRMGDKKTALFVVIPDADTTFNFIAAMMYSQLFKALYEVADAESSGRLKYHVRCILDEYANIGEIPDIDRYVATMRSREISVSIILQSVSQLKAIHEKTWQSLVDNCDSLLFLGGRGQENTEFISKGLGKETIETRNINYTKGRNASTSYNYGIQGRELLMPNEIAKIPNEYCILMIRGFNPFYSKKYALEHHKNYKYLFDVDSKNCFDVTKVRKYNDKNINPQEHEKVLDNYTINDFKLEKEQFINLFNALNDEIQGDEPEDFFLNSEIEGYENYK